MICQLLAVWWVRTAHLRHTSPLPYAFKTTKVRYQCHPGNSMMNSLDFLARHYCILKISPMRPLPELLDPPYWCWIEARVSTRGHPYWRNYVVLSEVPAPWQYLNSGTAGNSKMYVWWLLRYNCCPMFINMTSQHVILCLNAASKRYICTE
jgi:hypothetical protein